MAGTVIIGGGQAGAAAAAKLRALGYTAPVTLIAGEPVPPYQRPPLSKAYLLGEMEEERLYLRPAGWYADNDIDLRTGTLASDLDTTARSVKAGEETLSYEHCILSTGALPNRLPARIGGDLKGVYEVRTLADVDRMAPEVTEGRRALVVGGGYIGLEAAAVLTKRGVTVTLVELGPRILGRVAAKETADWIRALHEGRGVTLKEGVGLERLTGNGRVTRAELNDGSTLDVEFVVVGTGIRPDTRLAEADGITVDNGIVVDDRGRTSAAGVWAAGDCASLPWRGKRIRLESVQNAIDQAEAVAANIAGEGTVYDPVPWFWSDQYDAKLQIAGLNTGFERVIVRKGETGVSHWYFRGKELLAVDAMNAPRDYMVGKRLLEMGRTVDSGLVADPDTNLKSLLK